MRSLYEPVMSKTTSENAPRVAQLVALFRVSVEGRHVSCARSAPRPLMSSNLPVPPVILNFPTSARPPVVVI